MCAMKTLFKTLSVCALLSLGAISCIKEEAAPSNPVEDTVTINFIAESTDTKTYLDGDVIKWEGAGEKIRVFETVNGGTPASEISDEASIDENGVASFSASFTENTNEAEFVYHAVYPVQSDISNDGPLDFKAETPATQKPTATSFDGNADFLVAKEIKMTSQASTLSLQFKRIVAVGAMTIKGLPANTNITNIKFTATDDIDLTGRRKVDLSTGEVAETTYANGESYVILDYSETKLSTDADGIATAYFTCIPATLSTGFTIVLTTDTEDVYTKKVTSMGQELQFKAGYRTKFSANFAEIEPVNLPTYSLLTNVANLEVGDKMVIVCPSQGMAMGAQDGTVRSNVAIAMKEGDPTIKVAEDIQIIDVEAGYQEGTYAFNVGDKSYLALTANSNALYTSKNVSSLDESTSWNITLKDEGKLTINSVKYNTRYIQYNSNQPRFACYTGTQKDVAIYYKKGIPALGTPVIDDVNSKVDSEVPNKVVLNWASVEGADSYEVAYYPTADPTAKVSLPATGIEGTTATIEGLEYSTEYTFEVVAVPADLTVNLPSSAATINITTGKNPSALDTPDVIATAVDGVNSITVTWVPVANATSYDVSYEGLAEPVNVTDEPVDGYISYTFAGLDWNTSYTFSVVAKGAEGTTPSAPGTDSATTGSDPNVQTFTWKQVTSLADITPGEYIIVNGGYYLPNTAVTSGQPDAKSLNITFINGEYDGAVPEDAVWMFTGTYGAVTIKNADGEYLNAIDESKGICINNTSTDTWLFAVNDTGFSMKSKNGKRYCGVYDNKDWRSYTSTSNYTDKGILYLYKKYDPNAPVFYVDVNSLDFVAAGGSKTVTVTASNGEGNVTATCDNSHFSVSDPVDGVYTITAAANSTTSQITGTLTFTYAGLTETVSLAQDGLNPTVTIVGGNAVSLEATATGTQTIGYELADATDEDLTVTEDAGNEDWFTYVSAEDGEVTYSVTENKEPDSRVAKLTVSVAGGNSATITITQAGTAGESEPVVPKYVKVTTAPADWSGTYLITNVNENALYVLSGKNPSSNLASCADITSKLQQDGTIMADKVTSKYACTIEKTTNGYSIFVDGKYIGYTTDATASNNSLWFSESFNLKDYEWTLTLKEGNVQINNVRNTGRYIQFNYNGGNPRYAGYRTVSNMKDPVLYKLEN